MCQLQADPSLGREHPLPGCHEPTEDIPRIAVVPHMDAGDMKADDHWFWTQGMHQGYKADFSFKGVLNLRKISKHGVYVTPPTPSYIHAPEHRIRQRPSDLKEMAGTIKEGIQINATDVRMIRFDQITEFVDAVDGVHYGYNVNRVLFSIYLNGLK